LQHWWQKRWRAAPFSVTCGAFWWSGQMPQRWLKILQREFAWFELPSHRQ
jgi:hypothetical protein